VTDLPTSPSLADRIDALLPQTQCGQCRYEGCRPYAEALARGEAGHNHCPPGGDPTIRALARLLGREPLPLDTSYGETRPRALAVIDETQCIGCTLCIQDCPVDAIVGAAKLMHTVIADECTGCELCLRRCPVDCIAMHAVEDAATGWSAETAGADALYRAGRAGRRYHARRDRLARLRQARSSERARLMADAAADPGFHGLGPAARRQAVADAVERAKAKKARLASTGDEGLPRT
jgi:electron transport complex protein RnfB